MWAPLSRPVRTPLSTLWKVCVDAQSLRCVQLCEPMDCSPPGSTIHGIFQARILKWVAISFRGSSWPSDGICVSYIAGGFFTAEPPGSPTLKGYVATSLFSLLVLTIEKNKYNMLIDKIIISTSTKDLRDEKPGLSSSLLSPLNQPYISLLTSRGPTMTIWMFSLFPRPIPDSSVFFTDNTTPCYRGGTCPPLQPMVWFVYHLQTLDAKYHKEYPGQFRWRTIHETGN